MWDCLPEQSVVLLCNHLAPQQLFNPMILVSINDSVLDQLIHLEWLSDKVKIISSL